MKDDEIKIKIAEVAKEEFLSLGYVDASMRNISAKAGLTTGSLYNRFRDKAELFDFIVGNHVREVLDKFEEFNKKYALGTEQNAVIFYNNSAMKYLLDAMFMHYDSFDLVINKGAGSPYEDFMSTLIAIATENAYAYVESQKLGERDLAVAENLTHLLNVALFDAYAEIFRKHYTKEEADFYMGNVFRFYKAGWDAILAE